MILDKQLEIRINRELKQTNKDLKSKYVFLNNIEFLEERQTDKDWLSVFVFKASLDKLDDLYIKVNVSDSFKTQGKKDSFLAENMVIGISYKFYEILKDKVKEYETVCNYEKLNLDLKSNGVETKRLNKI